MRRLSPTGRRAFRAKPFGPSGHEPHDHRDPDAGFLRKTARSKSWRRQKHDVFNHNLETVVAYLRCAGAHAIFQLDPALQRLVKEIDHDDRHQTSASWSEGAERHEVLQVMAICARRMWTFLTMGILAATRKQQAVIAICAQDNSRAREGGIHKGFPDGVGEPRLGPARRNHAG